MLLATKPNLFIINTIILPELEILVMVTTDAKIDIDAKIDTDTKTNINMKINIKKLIFYFLHTPRENSINTMPP